MTDIAISIFDDLDNPHYGGGGATVVHEIATRLCKEYSVTVYSASYKGSRSQVRGGVRYVFLPGRWAGPRGGQLLFNLVLPLVALVRRPALWIESLTPPFSASLLPLVSRAPVVGLVQMLSAADMTRKYQKYQKYKLPFTMIERLGLRLYEHFVVLNETDGDSIQACNREAVCELIPNGITRPFVADEEFGQGRHILFLGRLDVEQKGIDLLLAAVSQEPPALPLIIAGSGTRTEERKVHGLLQRYSGQVQLVGRVTGAEKEELLRTCALVVVPSRYETFSLTALEAMAYGKPLVCFDLPRLSWIGADCAVRIPPFDTAELGRTLRALSVDPERRATLGRRGYTVSQEFDWDVIGKRYRALVAGVLRET